MAPSVSANGTRGFGQWISNRSMWSKRSFDRLSLTERMRSAGSRRSGCDLGGDHDVVALAGGAHALADRRLVAVHLRGVDVAIAERDGLLHQPRAIAPGQLPGAEPDNRQFEAVGNRRDREIHVTAYPIPAHAAD